MGSQIWLIPFSNPDCLPAFLFSYGEHQLMVRNYLVLGKDGYTMFNESQVVRRTGLSGQAMILDFFQYLNGTTATTTENTCHGVDWSSMYPHVVSRVGGGGGGKAIAPRVEGRIVRTG